MKYNFNKGVNRINTDARKYDEYKANFNTDIDDIIPMWIADMEFETCDEITKAIQEKLLVGNLGYDTLKGYYESIVNWMKKRHDLDISDIRKLYYKIKRASNSETDINKVKMYITQLQLNNGLSIRFYKSYLDLLEKMGKENKQKRQRTYHK